MIITPPFRWAQQSEVTSAFNIPAIVVASLAPVVSLEAVWYVKPKRSGVSCGGYWRRMVCSLWIEDQYDRVGALPALPLWVDGMFLVVFLFSVREQPDGSDVTAAKSQFYICVSSHYTVCTCSIISLMICMRQRKRLHVFVTVRCSTLQHSLGLVGWLL